VPEGPPIAVVDDLRFDRHRSADLHPERPERLVAARAGMEKVLPQMQRLDVEARPIVDDEAVRVHSPEYLSRLRQALGAKSGWGHIDADTYFCPDTEQAAWLAAGGAVELCRTLSEGKSRRGIALLRPPGHHACSSRAMGFCLLNNVAIAAADALARGASRVAIVDWDVHHGNGTQEIFYEEPRILFISLHQSPLYPGTGGVDEIGRGEARGHTINVPMPPHTGPDAYGEAFRSIVLPVLSRFQADIVLVSAGLDGHARDPLADLELDASCYGALTAALVSHADEIGHGRVGLFLEGGYDLSAIEDSFAAMIRALRGQAMALPSGSLRSAQSTALSKARRVAEQYWRI
jgi:acetoin utilization deacetylase AcuC-like enzyme